MSKKTILIIIGIFAIIAFGGGYVYYSTRVVNQNTSDDTSLTDKIFSPFGIGKSGDTGTKSIVDDANNLSKSMVDGIFLASKFKQITDFPVSGATFFIDQRPIQQKTEGVNTDTPATVIEIPTKPLTKTKNGKVLKIATPVIPPAPTTEPVPSIRYMKRSDGHIYQMYMDTKAVGQISNSTIPEVYDGIFASNPNNVVYRLLADDNQTIKTAFGALGGRASGFLPDNTTDISIAPNGNNIFYLSPYSDGVVGTISSFSDTKKNQIFNSSFTEWLTQWPNNQTIFLTTKASSDADGYLYSLSTVNNKFVKILSRIKGLTTLVSPSGDLVLYSSTTDSGPKLGIYSISKSSYTPINLYGLPEKCVWSLDSTKIYCAIPDGFDSSDYPDAWYQGRVSFNDTFMRINSETGSYSSLANSTYETGVDAIKMFTDDKEQTIFFVNKKDGYLWSLDIR